MFYLKIELKMKLTLQKARELHDLSQTELAFRLGVSRSLISMVLSGKRKLPPVALLKLQALSTNAPPDTAIETTPNEQEALKTFLTNYISDNRIKIKQLERKLMAMQGNYKKLRVKLQGLQTALEKGEFSPEIIRYEILTLTKRLKNNDLCQQAKLELQLAATKKQLKVAKLKRREM